MNYHNIEIPRMQEKKSKSLLLAASFYRLGMEGKALRCMDCGTFVEVTTIMDSKTGIKRDQVTAANFCRERLCPMCSWRRSARIYSTTSQILDYLDSPESGAIPHKYLFLTLTVRNCQFQDLGKTLDQMAESYHRMAMSRAWKRRILGAMRTTEITINHADRTAHPHYHLILMVPKSYGAKKDKLYWSQEDWMEIWKKSARLDYNPNTWIERVRGGRHHGIAEVSKYLAKDSDYLTDDDALTDELVVLLTDHLKGRRLVSYSGELLRAQRALKIQDPEEAPLTDTIRGDIAVAIRRCYWSAGMGEYRVREVEKD